LLATGGYDKAIKLWDLRFTKEPVVTWRKAHEDWLSSLQMDVSGERLISASFDGTVKIHRLFGKQTLEAVAAHAVKWRKHDAGGLQSPQPQVQQLKHHSVGFGHSYSTPAVEHVLKHPGSTPLHASICTDQALLAVGAGSNVAKWRVCLGPR
jgi:WD40 repeat protein